MKRRKIKQITIAAVVTAMLFGGCGEAPYDLTEREEGIIVDYAAHIVSKYNSYQKDGLTWVDFEEVKEAEQEEADAKNTEDAGTAAEEGGQTSGDTQGEGGAAPVQTATLTELFGSDGIQIEYTGSYLIDSFMQETYYVMYPDAGNQYLVLQIAVSNSSGEEAMLDNLTKAASFYVSVNGETEAASEITILMEDFAQFQGAIAADATQDTVLIFQIPDTVTQIDSLTLSVEINGGNYQITL